VRLLIVMLIALACALGGVASAQAVGAGPTSSAAEVKASAPKAKRAHRVVRKRAARPAVHRARAARAAKVKASRHAPARPAATAGMPRV
jgi:hypothetical protein